jgi:hypothetical protein
VAVGVQALWDGGRAWWRVVAALAAVAILVVVGEKTTVSVRRAIDGAYVVPNDLRNVQAHLSGVDGPIYLEAPGQGFEAPVELPSIYQIANEATRQRLALSMESNDYAGLAYLGGTHPPRAEFTPDYRYILTRADGIATARRVVARSGAFALERRATPLDVAITSGVALDTARDDPQGRAWVQGPMTFWITGPGPQQVWLRLLFTGSGAIRVAQPPGSKILRQTRSATEVCVPVPPSAAPRLRRATVTLADYPPPGGQPTGREFMVRMRPGRLVRLAGMWATTQDCTR